MGTILSSPNHIWAGLSSVQELAKVTDILSQYTHPSTRQCTIPTASSTQDGLMSSEMVTMLSSITEAASIFTGSYVGNGGTDGEIRLEFPKPPKILFFSSEKPDGSGDERWFWFPGIASFYVGSSSDYILRVVTSINSANSEYCYLALL